MAIDLRLEPFTAAHLDALAAVSHDPDVLRFTGFPDPPQPGFARGWLERYTAGRAEGTREAYAVLDPDDGAFLGLALATRIDRHAREVELGYLVVPAARGRGVAGEVLRRLTRWAFDELDALRLTLLIDVENGASRAVAERCGYRLEGVRRNAYVKPGRRADTAGYARLREDPEPEVAGGLSPR